jgi:phosphoribosylamine---glycine ligase
MNILLIGSGGREHALAWKMSQSPLCKKLYCAPGNAGISQHAACVDIAVDDIETLMLFAKEHDVDFVVPGPEATLVAGISDACAKEGIACFGPDKAAARLEGSKGFMKDLCKKYNIPTADYARFTDLDKARTFIAEHKTPVVVKADGLAAGKGVIICHTLEDAVEAAEMMMQEYAFGAAGQEIVIEEFLDGEEISFFAISDGEKIVPMGSAQDHKRAHDGDAGPNTGGMGAYAPVPFLTPQLEERIINETLQPLVDGMAAEGHPFKGVIFAGLMVKGEQIKILEYNARFGDPECQILMMRLQSDLVELLHGAATGKLGEISAPVWKDISALTVVMAAEGYPEPYKKGTEIRNLPAANDLDSVQVFHAGTILQNGKLVNSGGRVLNVTATGEDIKEAQAKAYEACALIDWPDGFYRNDIGWRAIK